MDDWIPPVPSTDNGRQSQEFHHLLSGCHVWNASHYARPVYCNICGDALSGVSMHGYSCEICKFKIHKRCLSKAINNCKWTTLASIGKDIIEDRDGVFSGDLETPICEIPKQEKAERLLMPHQWMEGNLPVASKCGVCYKNCGSVLRLRDWRCLWCRATVHTACRPKYPSVCSLGSCRISIVPPTALHSIGNDDAWDAVRPQDCSPLLVFVNSKSGDNQGVKFLRRFKQLLNPAQVFDLISSGPVPGLRLFRHFDPFRILICSGDGSVGWVLSAIDQLDMQNQCYVGTLPLGTGNDLARVLGWGSSCDDDTNLLQLIEKYEMAGTHMLDRWSVMTYECPRAVATSEKECDEDGTMATDNKTLSPLNDFQDDLSDNIMSHLIKIIESDDYSDIIQSSKALCETVKDFSSQVAKVCHDQGDYEFGLRCRKLKEKFHHLLQNLNQEEESGEPVPKDLSRANSLKKAVQQFIKHADVSSTQNYQQTRPKDSLKVCPEVLEIPHSSSTPSISNLTSISPIPDRRDSTCEDGSINIDVESLPVPSMFADNRRGSNISRYRKLSLSTKTGDGLDISRTPYSRRNTFETVAVIESVDILSDISDSKAETFDVEGDDDESKRYFHHIKTPEDSLDVEEDGGEGTEKEVSKEKPVHHGILAGLKMSDDVIAQICHIDSSETSDESPDSSSSLKKKDKERYILPKTEDRDAVEPLPFSPVRKKSDTDVDIDATNLISTSPEDEDDEDLINELGILLNERTRRQCSLAHFVEGNDIARRSIKCRHQRPDFDPLECEPEIKSPEVADKIETLNIPEIQIQDSDSFAGSNVVTEERLYSILPDLLNISVDNRSLSPFNASPRPSLASSEADDEELLHLHGLTQSDSTASGIVGPTVIINPPSPPAVDNTDNKQDDLDDRRLSYVYCRKLSAASPYSMLQSSPCSSRRISSASLMHSDSVDQAATPTSTGSRTPDSKNKKALPIINPLVRLPSWPNVSSKGGSMISKALLANADALCAPAVPLMDPLETVMEGYMERCVMNNYFGIGIDAKISLDFHLKREEHPEKCRSRARNYIWYGVLGSKEFLHKTYKNLEKRVQLFCDGYEIPLPSLQGIVVLNIPSFMGGTNFWGGTKEDDLFLAPSMDDKILEVVAVFGSMQMAASRIINLQRHRIAQCKSVQITIRGNKGVAVQVDGEAWVQPPGVIRIIHKNRMKMLCRSRVNYCNKLKNRWIKSHSATIWPVQCLKAKTLETSLKSWQRQKQLTKLPQRSATTSGSRPVLYSDEEMQLLQEFLESTTNLVQCIKMLTIRHASVKSQLYNLAIQCGDNIEKIHPGGKFIKGIELRREVTELVSNVRLLHEEACVMLKEKSHILRIPEDLEAQLSSALHTMETEFSKCQVVVLPDTGEDLVYLTIPLPDEDRKGRSKGHFWLKFKRDKSCGGMASEVASWGVQEVIEWLDTLGLNEYAEAFKQHDIRGRELLTLNRRDIKELGINKVGHIKRILQAIKDLGM